MSRHHQKPGKPLLLLVYVTLFQALFGSTLAAVPDELTTSKAQNVANKGTIVQGEILDAQLHPVASRLYIQDYQGTWYFPHSASTNGTALRYQIRNWLNTNVVEMHTTLSAHPFEIELPPGRYTFTVERGKEYFPEIREVIVGDQPVSLEITLRRWIDLASRGWFSGDTHVHRAPADLPNLMLAEDLNVACPLVYWTTQDDLPPSRGNKNTKGEFPTAAVQVDPTHLYLPRNTEYEIFTTAKSSHTLGALLVLNHQTVFDLPALPLTPIAERAHAEHALLDLEKHNWPWSMALVPLVKPDLFELANNHHWETSFSITNWAVPAPGWMNIESGSDDELEWTLYGFLNYYALLDCGFRLSPSAGTANGVHPVPLGFSRVYVHLPRGFSSEAWLEGLKAGRSFVTTGPMLLVTVNDEDPGFIFRIPSRPKAKPRFHVKGEILSSDPVDKLEFIVNGQVARATHPISKRLRSGASQSHFDTTLELDSSGWLAVRCWEPRQNGRFRFAHTGPWFVEMDSKPLRPRREEAEFLVNRVEQEIARSGAVLPRLALEEYRRALRIYQTIAQTAR